MSGYKTREYGCLSMRLGSMDVMGTRLGSMGVWVRGKGVWVSGVWVCEYETREYGCLGTRQGVWESGLETGHPMCSG